MALKHKKTSSPSLGSLRPPPLSYHSVSGFTWVLREDNTVLRIHELVAGASPCKRYRLQGPEGIVEVQIQIGGFQDKMQVAVMRDEEGREVTFCSTLKHLRLDAQTGYSLECGVFNGFTVTKGERKCVHLRAIELLRDRSVDHYAYSMTPCAIYLGAGRKPIFLPFEVT